MALNPYTTANRGGIPRIESNSVVVGTDRVTFNFGKQRALNYPYNGLVAFKISQEIPAGITTTLPVYFGTHPLVSYNSAPVTVAALTGVGILLCWYDSTDNLLQLINIT